ncbi:GvpL/GvpF family gas vesicle protein [Nonomuraea aurantiaca]|uniref:GvpL/GvpF family gas vesicle protein n=1 Tax=Nonomuraea aurantiaca TaxID=2878562 RepID=UPI001CD96E99|nr:GvpL/GvpF family gas vesicle protein [Nonomuraea aurantiaca]MCA2225698.1 GvpL/GvpF family gas vesicle protein [Nonomuraea aurantiaca]
MAQSAEAANAAGQDVPEQVTKTAGVYIYGLVPEDVEVSSDARGVGDETSEIRLVRHGEIAALVSDVTLDRPLGTPDDLFRHGALLDATAAEVPVIPLRFGSVMTNEEAVVEELLTPHHDEFRSALDELEGRAEYVIKGRYVDQTLFREVLSEIPEAAQLREQIQGQPEDLTRNARIRLGELINQAVVAKREADTQAVAEEVGPLATLTVIREPSHEQDAVHVAVLMETDRQDELERVVNEFAERWSERVEMRILGPLAPYDFITARTQE